MSSTVELFLLIVVLYLYDSSVLLFSNEAVLIRRGSGRWDATLGWRNFVFAGRVLCVLNPFTPHRPTFRLHWQFDSLVADVSEQRWPVPADLPIHVAPLTLTAALGLFVLLPLGLFTPAGTYADIAGIAMFYIATAWALYRIKGWATPESAQWWGFAAFAFECLVCPPFGVNMVRRMTLTRRILEPLPLAAARLLDAPSWNILRAECVARLDEALRLAADDETESRLLEVQKQRIYELARPP